MSELLARKLKAEARKRYPDDKERQKTYIAEKLRVRFGWSQEEMKQYMANEVNT